MLTPVLCMTCGRSVGEYGDVFRRMRQSVVEAELKARGVDPTRMAADAGMRVECGSIFDSLGIGKDRPCCRTTLMCTMIFSDHYNGLC